jgi:lipopolysaccharide export system permease protein
MLQNKIYQNFIKEILKTFLVILFGLSVIAWTVRAVSFLDLIVENGYSIITYFQYSFLNLFGIMTKFIPLSFLLSLMIFIIKQLQENEFIILWTSGVKKLRVINLFFIVSIFIFIFYICFSAFITPFALNKSRLLLSKDGFNSFLPTIRIQQFSDSFEGFTFIVDKKFKNQIKNVFIHDESNTLKNIASDSSDNNSTTIIAQEGIVEEKRMLLFDGKIIFSKKEKFENNIVKFSQLNIDLKDLKTSTIKNPKLQETFTLDLIRCIFGSGKIDILNCKEHTKNEIITNLNRRLVLPLYIPVIALMCSFLLIKTRTKNNYFLNKNTIFIFSFLILLYAELIIRYTGVSRLIGSLFLISPILLMPIIYVTLMFKLSNESLKK